MINRSLALRNALLLALTLATALMQNACRTDKPGPEPAGGSADTAGVAAEPALPPADTAAVTDSSGGLLAVDGPGPGPGGSTAAPGWNRTELVQGMQRFITAIDSGNREMFWSSLSERSVNQIEKGGLGTREEIWSTARQTLGDIENRKITVIGGSSDSVALRIDGLRLIDSVRERDPIIIHLLHEGNDWKVMYPGLLYPMHHLRR